MEEEGKLIIEKAGKQGRFQKLSYIFIIWYSAIVYYTTTSLPFQKIRPNAVCRQINDYTSEFIPCDEETYCDPKYEKIIIREGSIRNWAFDFEMDCSKESQFEYVIMSIFAGGFASFLILSVWADKYGRKIVLQCEVFGIITVISLALLANSFYMICILWFFYEFFNHLVNLVIIYASETMAQDYYSYVCMFSNMSFPTVGLLTSLMFYSIRNWWYIQIIFMVGSIVCGILFQLIVLESPLFCLQTGDPNTFVEAITKMSKINSTHHQVQDDLEKFRKKFSKTGAREEELVLKEIKTGEDMFLPNARKMSFCSTSTPQVENSSFWTLFLTDQDLRFHFLALTYSYCVVMLVFYGIILNIERFDRNVFLFSAVFYASEIMAEFISGLLSQKYGRTRIIIINYLVMAFSFLMFDFFENIFFAKVFFCFWGNFGTSSSFSVIMIYMPEVFPVRVRSTCVSYCKILPQFIVIFSPIIVTHIPRPFIFFSVIGLSAAYVLKNCRETLEDNNSSVHSH